jgi:hypothetical protein
VAALVEDLVLVSLQVEEFFHQRRPSVLGVVADLPLIIQWYLLEIEVKDPLAWLPPLLVVPPPLLLVALHISRRWIMVLPNLECPALFDLEELHRHDS